MKLLSPKKYIETKVRSLPVYKCFVNKDWRQSKMADVIVMRKHANGNITTGMFLVDLLCLGVKDTNFFFNEGEDDITGRLKPILDFCEPIDYNTAHNIVYAGHDFAFEFGIKPHKDFAITKYILQPDDDRIPLIEIPTGADDGKPFLVADQPGQYADALLKLKKNAGEGNYYYSTGIDNEVPEDATKDPDAEFSEFLADYEEEAVTPLAVQYLADKEIKDEEKVKTRSALEQLTIGTENFYRIYKSVQPEDFYQEDVTGRAEYQYLTEALKTTNIDSAENKAFVNATGEVDEYFARRSPASDDKEFFENVLHKYQESAFAISHLHEYFIFEKAGELITIAVSYLEKLAATKVMATLSLALAAFIKNISETRFDFLNREADVFKAFPAKEKWDVFELGKFWLIQAYIHARKGDLKNAFHYYELFAETSIQSWLLPYVQLELCNRTRKLLEEIFEQKKIELDKMREAQDEGNNS